MFTGSRVRSLRGPIPLPLARGLSWLGVALLVVSFVPACRQSVGEAQAPTTTTMPARGRPQTLQPSASEHSPAPPITARRPAWLGTRVLPPGLEGFGRVLPTPEALRDRRLATVDVLPPPDGKTFRATVSRVPAGVAARSTWSPACPVTLEELAYLRLSFWGFDGRAHTGELLVHDTAAEELVSVFRTLYNQRFPIEEMRVVAPAELDAPPTGDGNNTTAFVCRPVRGSSNWSQHAYGLAVDVNPFHNPYTRGELVLPELASSYLNRARHRPGMIRPGDVVTAAFDRLGWEWGGRWHGMRDWMHFSENGR